MRINRHSYHKYGDRPNSKEDGKQNCSKRNQSNETDPFYWTKKLYEYEASASDR